MKKVLVTGGLGFIGSNWVLKNLNNYEISIVDNESEGSNINNISKNFDGIVDKKIKNILNFDIGEIPNEIIERIKPDAILNFAAQSHVDRSIDNPLSFFESNVMGTAKLLEQVRTLKPDTRFVHVSTDEVYGHLGKDDSPFTEDTKYDPRSPYSASKASSDHIVKAYGHTYGLDVVITNCCNNYGTRQNEEKLIPLLINNIVKEKELPIYGDGKNIREWIHVNDHNSAVTLVLEKGKSNETYCIGSGEEKENIEIVNMLCEIMHRIDPNKEDPKKLITYVEDRKGHDFRYAIDSSKIRNELGWKPLTPFAKGLKETAFWYFDILNRYNK